MTQIDSDRSCHVLAEDPELAEGVDPVDRERATADCTARALRLAPGRWEGERARELGEGIGLLVLCGLLLRRVGIEGRYGAELLGEGDLLRPWQGEDEPPTLAVSIGWRVLAPTRMAVLDERFARELTPYPSVSSRLVARALQRSRNLAVNMAIVHQARVDVRLHMLLWHLAARWGKVRSDGVTLPLRLTHTVLAELVAARRPTVSSALSDLARRGAVTPHPDGGWMLHGEPPGELLEIEPAKLGAGD